MSKTYGNDLKLAIIQSGTQSGTWGEVTNDNLEQIVKGIGGFVSVSCSDPSPTVVPFTSAQDDESSNQTFRNLYLSLSGTVTASPHVLQLPAIEKMYVIKNGTNQNVEVKTSTQSTGITIKNSQTAIVYVDGTNVVTTFDFFETLTIGTPTFSNALTVPNGGTGNGGPSGITSGALLIGNGTGALTERTGTSVNDFLQWNGSTWVSQAVTPGSGTVTSVDGSGTVNGITLGGGPITGSGTLTLSGSITGVVKTDSSGALQSVNGNFQINKSTPILFLGTATSGSYFGFNESGNQVNLVSSGTVQIGLVSSQIAVNNHMIPSVDATYDLGTGSFRYKDIFASGTVTSSDQRLKNSIQDTDLGLSFVNALTPRKYKMSDGTPTLSSPGTDTSFPQYTYSSGTRFHYGLVSQEVVTVLDNQGIDKSLFGGWTLDDPSDPDSRQSLRYHEFISPMIKAIQELSAKVDALEQRVQQLESN